MRKAASRGKEITLPPDIPMKPGDQVVQYYDDFVLIVPVAAIVDEFLLRRAVKGPDSIKGEASADGACVSA